MCDPVGSSELSHGGALAFRGRSTRWWVVILLLGLNPLTWQPVRLSNVGVGNSYDLRRGSALVAP